jgi:hypothetical protein
MTVCVYEQEVSRSAGVDTLNLYRFLVSNLTRNDELCAKFNVSLQSSDLSTNPQYYIELNRNLLEKFFSLMLLLDVSKTHQVTGSLNNQPHIYNGTFLL